MHATPCNACFADQMVQSWELAARTMESWLQSGYKREGGGKRGPEVASFGEWRGEGRAVLEELKGAGWRGRGGGFGGVGGPLDSAHQPAPTKCVLGFSKCSYL